MRVLQLIDSLQTGGAERVAVNIANALISRSDGSFLCATRDEGQLKESINSSVKYLFLNKKKIIDIRAITKLSSFVKSNKIDVIHAHSSSFFLATIIKLLNWNVNIVWHEHLGNRAEASKISILILKQCSRFFSHIFCVNHNLVDWAKHNLKCNSISFLLNFVVQNSSKGVTKLNGLNGKRIICIANLRPDKDHLNAINAFNDIKNSFPEWTLHIVGKDFEDDYSSAIKQNIKTLQLDKYIFVYGSKPDIPNILNQSSIAILSSKSEGLPIALLEYGLIGLPTIVTNVGNCNLVVKNDTLGLLIPPENSKALSQALSSYINEMENAKNKGKHLKAHVQENFSANAITTQIIQNYKRILE